MTSANRLKFAAVFLFSSSLPLTAESIYLSDPTISSEGSYYKWTYQAELVGTQSYVWKDDGFTFTADGILSLLAPLNWNGSFVGNEVTFTYNGAQGPIGPGTTDLGSFSVISSYNTGVYVDFLAWDHRGLPPSNMPRNNTDIILAPGAAVAVPESSAVGELMLAAIMAITVFGLSRRHRQA